ncbi:hypothetical protein N4235_20045 [Enterobacter asburiae]|uniref:hypothetical protein n=1 Tax=Enterobacter asburiae TaxID=61645 RepID=UPI00296686C5|nr:hypothetical protein [Enterobacter asburiae]MDW3573174.1 hypothetical protein [Enterobacter asburiae]
MSWKKRWGGTDVEVTVPDCDYLYLKKCILQVDFFIKNNGKKYMKTYPDTDEIKEKTMDILKGLSMLSITERYGLASDMALLESCVSEEEYDYYEYYESGYALLKSLIRARMRLKRIASDDFTTLSCAITELRTQLKENEAYFLHLVEVQHFSSRFSVAIKILGGFILALVLAWITSKLSSVGF